MDAPLALIVEDDYDASVIFSEALQAAGFETEIIRSGDKALERLAAVTPQVIVLDLHLPRVAGMTILDRIHTSPQSAKTQIIVVTGDAALADDPTLQRRAFQILVKPASYRQIRDLARLLKLSSRRSP